MWESICDGLAVNHSQWGIFTAINWDYIFLLFIKERQFFLYSAYRSLSAKDKIIENEMLDSRHYYYSC